MKVDKRGKTKCDLQLKRLDANQPQTAERVKIWKKIS